MWILVRRLIKKLFLDENQTDDWSNDLLELCFRTSWLETATPPPGFLRVTSDPTACTQNIYDHFQHTGRHFTRVLCSRVRTRLETFSPRPPLTDLPTPARFSLNRLHEPDNGLRFLLSRCSVNTSRASRPHRSASSPDCFTARPAALKCFYCWELAEMEGKVKCEATKA